MRDLDGPERPPFAPGLDTGLIRTDAGLQGHVFDPARPAARFVVELLVDGLPVALARAHLYRPDLEAAGHGDGCHGFFFVPPADVRDALFEVRLANTGEPVGEPERGDADPVADPDIGSVSWAGGLRLTGTMRNQSGGGVPQIVRAVLDGQVVAETQATSWTHRQRGETWVGAPGFDLRLPDRLADGRAHRVTVTAGDGTPLSGSPCVIIAFPDGLAAHIEHQAEVRSEMPRAAVFDAILPRSVPLSAYAEWAERFPAAQPPTPPRSPVAVVIVGEAGLDASLASLAEVAGCDWLGVALPAPEGQATFPPGDLRRFLATEAAGCETVVFASAGTRLAPLAPALLAEALGARPRASAAYGDLELREDDRTWPLLLPAFDYERCLEQGYCALVFGLRRGAALAALDAGATDLFRLFGAHLDAAPDGLALPIHVPGVLAELPDLDLASLTPLLAAASERHLAACGSEAVVAARAGADLPAVRVSRTRPAGMVSIVILAHHRLERLQACLTALLATVDAEYELVVADYGPSGRDQLAFLEALAHPNVKLLEGPGQLNAAEMLNRAAAIAEGEFLLMLEDDVEAGHAGWLEEMLGRLAAPDVGAVGALVAGPGGVVRHGGLVLGPGLAAAEAFRDRLAGDPGPAGLLGVAHECAAVSRACLLTRRDLFLSVGGFDALRFPNRFTDVDYCLRLRAAGLRIVWTPDARLTRSAGDAVVARDEAGPHARELVNLRARWGEALVADPCYSPLLALDHYPYSGLAWPPRDRAPRQPAIGRRTAVPFHL